MHLRPQRLALPCQSGLIAESPSAPNTIPPAACLLLALNGRNPRYGPSPHQGMNISQGERGGNGVGTDVVKEWCTRRLSAFINAGNELSLAIGDAFPHEVRIGKGGRVV
jgi:hypothetical protein